MYIIDMIVKSHRREDHMVALEKFLTRIEKCNFILNSKCLLEVTIGKLKVSLLTEGALKLILIR